MPLEKKLWNVVNYRKFTKTIQVRDPLPNIPNVLNKLRWCNYFTNLHLFSGFLKIGVDRCVALKTLLTVEKIITNVRMPFNLKNGTATIQRIMNNALRGLQNEICSAYRDNIIVYIRHCRNAFSTFEVFQWPREPISKFSQTSLNLWWKKLSILHKLPQ